VTRLPGFGALHSLPRSEPSDTGSTARRVPSWSRDARAAPLTGNPVIPAQLDWVSILKEGYRYRQVFADIDCPRDQRPTLVRECVWSLPLYDCVWLGGGRFKCEIKRWVCQAYQETWQCQPRTLSLAKT
jgi:hypothetical protein